MYYSRITQLGYVSSLPSIKVKIKEVKQEQLPTIQKIYIVFLSNKNRAKIAPAKYQKAYNKNQALKHERRYKQIMKIKKEEKRK